MTATGICYVAYESPNNPHSTGEVVCFADTIVELARRLGVSRDTVQVILKANREGRIYKNRIGYEIQEVFLN